MTSDAPVTARPTPPRRSLFAVWRWPRWVLVTAALIGALIYIGSYVPCFECAIRLDAPGFVFDAIVVVFAPVDWLYENTGIIDPFIDGERHLLWSLLGQPTVRLDLIEEMTPPGKLPAAPSQPPTIRPARSG